MCGVQASGELLRSLGVAVKEMDAPGPALEKLNQEECMAAVVGSAAFRAFVSAWWKVGGQGGSLQIAKSCVTGTALSCTERDSLAFDLERDLHCAAGTGGGECCDVHVVR